MVAVRAAGVVVVAAVIMVAMVMIVIVIVVLGLQKLRLQFEDAVEIEGLAVEHGVERDIAFPGAVQFGVGIEAANARLDLFQFVLVHKVDLVEQDDIGENDLVLGFRRVLEAGGQEFGVGDGDDGVEPRLVLHVGVHEKGLRHGRRDRRGRWSRPGSRRTCPCGASGPR